VTVQIYLRRVPSSMREVLNYNKITARIMDFTQCRYRDLMCSMACYLTSILGINSDLKGWCLSYMLCGLLSVLWSLPCLRSNFFGLHRQHTLSVKVSFFFLWRCHPTRVMAFSFLRFLDHTKRRTTVGRTHLEEWSARRRDLYLTTHNTHNKHPCPQWDSNARSQ
jgi:hypothetical protein